MDARTLCYKQWRAIGKRNTTIAKMTVLHKMFGICRKRTNQRNDCDLSDSSDDSAASYHSKDDNHDADWDMFNVRRLQHTKMEFCNKYRF